MGLINTPYRLIVEYLVSVVGALRFQAIRLTLRPHLVEMRPPVGLPPVGATLEGTVVRIDPTGLLLTVSDLASTRERHGDIRGTTVV